jgi:hypothetical protein
VETISGINTYSRNRLVIKIPLTNRI